MVGGYAADNGTGKVFRDAVVFVDGHPFAAVRAFRGIPADAGGRSAANREGSGAGRRKGEGDEMTFRAADLAALQRTASPATARAVSVVVPVRTVSEANAHWHWRHRQRRA